MRVATSLFAVAFFSASAFAQAPAKVDAKTKLAMQLMEGMHFDRTVQQMADQIPAMMAKQFDSFGDCPASSAVIGEMSAKMGEKMATVMKSDAMKIDSASVYAEVFSEDELRELIAFYQSPIGRKLVDKMPELAQKSMQISQDRVKEVMPDVQAIGEEYSERIREAAQACKTPPAAK